VRQIFDQAMGTTPVSAVDVDHVVAKGRRRSIRRRLAVAGAAGGTAIAAVGIVTALVLNAGGPPSQPPRLAEPGGGNTTAAVHDGKAPVRSGETEEQTKQRLAAALTAGLTTALPGVRLSDGPTGQAGVVIYHEGTSPQYDTDTVLSTAAGSGELFLVSQPGDGPTVAPTASGWPSDAPPPVTITWLTSCSAMPSGDKVSGEGYRIVDECQQSTGPAGQTVVAVTERCVGCPGPTLSYDVYVTWTNARVELAVDRDTKRGGSNDSLSAPVLSRDQAIAIAVDPELTVTT
jgi:hypothetical protein